MKGKDFSTICHISSVPEALAGFPPQQPPGLQQMLRLESPGKPQRLHQKYSFTLHMVTHIRQTS